MKEHTIFTFWEPRESIPAYLRLCRETWLRHSPGFTIVQLNYDNLEHYTGPGVLDLETLKSVALHIQKDAILFAVLARNGGIFMDMDTIVFGDLSSLEGKLRNTELLMFHVHMGVVAARPGSRLLRECLAGVQQRLSWLREGSKPLEDVRWDYFGNSILHQAMSDASCRNNIIVRMQNKVLSAFARGLERMGRRGGQAAVFIRRVDQYIANYVFFKHTQRDMFLMLRRDRHGFIAERVHGDRRIHNPAQKYLEYWFGESDKFQRPPPVQSAVIGLHNSWTPGWYAALSETEVLNHQCLLSRTLCQALDRIAPPGTVQRHGPG